LAALRSQLRGLDGLLVAFSGGVDSAVLLQAAVEALGPRAVGVIADSPSLPRAELKQARELASAMGARLRVVSTRELEQEAYRVNGGDRCFYCKNALFEAMVRVGQEEGIVHLAFGEIVEDHLDDRPGARAAKQWRVLAPLSAAGLGKEDVRRRARELGLEVWDKPASACLASRIPVGTRVTADLLAQVERAEAGLRELGLRELRVRHKGAQARLELGEEDWKRGLEMKSQIEARLASSGFEFVEWARYVPGHLRPVEA
jgi:uncharacterized protein